MACVTVLVVLLTACAQGHAEPGRTSSAGMASPPSGSSPLSGAPSTKAVDAAAQRVLLPQHLLGASDVWRKNVAGAPVAGDSAASVRGLERDVQARYGGIAAFNAYQYNPTWYTVSAEQPTVTVEFDNCQGKPSTPPGLFGPGGQFVGVPLPADAVPSTGSDATLAVYRTTTDQLWDFWRVRHVGSRWSACWGGRIDHLTRSSGQFPFPYGEAATGLAAELGCVSIRDARSGVIDHAVALQISDPAIYTRVSWPARRSDGSNTDPAALPEGSRLRLDPALNVAALHLTPIATMIAKAAQRYGFIVTDRSDGVAVTAESGVPLKQQDGQDPWATLLRGTQTYSVMKDFPWEQMQVLAPDWGKPANVHD